MQSQYLVLAVLIALIAWGVFDRRRQRRLKEQSRSHLSPAERINLEEQDAEALYERTRW